MQNKISVTVSLLVMFWCFHTQAVSYTNCGSSFTFDNVEVEGCGSDSCVLTIGTSVEISFSFDNDARKIDAQLINDVGLYVYGTKFNVTVTPDNPCSVLKCPIQTNYSTIYTAKLFISEIFPPLHADFKWIMKARADEWEQLVCFTFPVVLMRPRDPALSST